MMVARKRERFPLPRTSGRCRFGQQTFAGASGNDEDAPKTAFCIRGVELAVSTPSRHLVQRTLSTWRSDRSKIEISGADKALARNLLAIERFEGICSVTTTSQ
jgi:hypothetical protein